MITKFQALVARESLAEVYPEYGPHSGGMYSDHGATVAEVHESSALIECCSNRFIVAYSNLTPSRHLLALIESPSNESGSYSEARMEWKGRNPETGEVETIPLSY